MPILPWRLLTIALTLVGTGLALAPLLLPGAEGASPAPGAAAGASLHDPIGWAVTLAAALAALVLAVLGRGRGAAASGFGLLATLLLAAACAVPWLDAPPVTGAALRVAGLVGLILAALVEKRHDPLANSAYTAARRLGVPERQPRRG
ncbi:hypothetical protein [Benzoatithermus flavus]|uniref:Tryptophan-associated transmembrane protein (Trp_oprn_chp) n=1 Tax=Benzoatithermus flavus TaxID=3108223 RepID=A0ABU8XPX1_9PROT